MDYVKLNLKRYHKLLMYEDTVEGNRVEIINASRHFICSYTAFKEPKEALEKIRQSFQDEILELEQVINENKKYKQSIFFKLYKLFQR